MESLEEKVNLIINKCNRLLRNVRAPLRNSNLDEKLCEEIIKTIDDISQIASWIK